MMRHSYHSPFFLFLTINLWAIGGILTLLSWENLGASPIYIGPNHILDLEIDNVLHSSIDHFTLSDVTKHIAFQIKYS